MKEDSALENIQLIITKNFKDALVWDQRSGGLKGKYFYVKYTEKEIGVFIGYTTDKSGNIKGCTTFFFVHPINSMVPAEVKNIEKLFHKIMIRANMSLNKYPYRLVRSGLPALVRNMYFDGGNKTDAAINFFEEALAIVKQCEALYLK